MIYPIRYVSFVVSDYAVNIDKLIENPRIVIKNISVSNFWFSEDYMPEHVNDGIAPTPPSKYTIPFIVDCYIRIKHKKKLNKILRELTVSVEDILSIVN